MRFVVFGGRFFTDKPFLWSVLDKIYKEFRHTGTLVIIEGGQDGADYFARQWVRKRQKEGWDIEGIRVDAEWRLYGKAAGPIRNQRMIDEFHPELGVAFKGHKGTRDMLDKLHKAKIPVRDMREVGYGLI